MSTQEHHPEFKIPIHLHRGKNYLRYLAIFLLTGIVIFSVILMIHFGLTFLPVFLVAIFGACCIRFPLFILYDDCFVIEKRGLIKQFSDFDLFKFEEIKSVEFSKGFTDWIYVVVLALLGSGGPGGNSKADQMIILTNEDKTVVFNRFGSRSGFVAAIGMLQNKIQ